MTATIRPSHLPLTNAEIAERDIETARKYGTVSVGTGLGTVQHSYTIGSWSVVWGRKGAEVRDSGGRVIFAGTKDECFAFARR